MSYVNDFGLMFYNARWYDPALGRFAQADTIVPGGVQGYDRYAYVNNSPVRYIDPTGHRVCEDIDGDRCISSPNTPKGNDPVHLTHANDPIPGLKGKFYRVGGYELYNLYLDYKHTDGWWNDYGKAEFGIEEFVGMYFLFESNSDPTMNREVILATITAQNLYVGGFNPPTCDVGGKCFNAVFNFLAANIDGGSGLLAGPQNDSVQRYPINTPKMGDEAVIRNNMSILGNSALDPSMVITWDRNSGPSSWGNDNLWKRKLNNREVWPGYHGLAEDTVYYYIGNTIYYSVDQYNYWIGQK